MGRPIKIRHTNGSTPVDTGYNNPAGSGNTYGVVGGITSQSGSQILCSVKLPSLAVGNGYIVRQRSATKFLVANATAINDEAIVAGVTYIITTLGTTNWAALGASSNAAVGDVFTATVAGTGLTTTGVVNQVGICALSNTAPLTVDGTMSITATRADASTFRLAKLSSYFGLDFLGNGYVLSFNAAAVANPSNGQPYPIVQVASA